MSSGKKLTNEEVLEKISLKCKEKKIDFIGFDNEENIYKNNKTYLILKCQKCGNTWNTTSYDKFVARNNGCPNCAVNKKLSEKEITDKINEICKNKNFTFLGFYGDFKGIYSKLILKCNKCHEIWNTTSYHNLQKTNRNTHTCGRKNHSYNSINLNEERIIKLIKEKIKNTNLEFISFDENGYVGAANSHVLLKCKKCKKLIKYSLRYILQTKISCKNCEFNGKFSNEYSIEKINEKCKALNYTFLGFDNEENVYQGKNTYLILKCDKCGYIWKSTTFASFCQNTIKCLGCVNSWKMEKEIEYILEKNKINYIHDCRSKILPWLKNKISLSLDFYLPEYKIGIECQGRQHFEPVLDFGGEKSFEKTIERDKKKLILCKENNVKLLYYDSENNHTSFLNEKVYNEKNNLIKEIIKYGQKN